MIDRGFIDIETHLRSYERSAIIQMDTRIMCGRAANEIVRLRARVTDLEEQCLRALGTEERQI